MFTGIITDLGQVQSITGTEDSGLSFEISTSLAEKDLAVGASVACSGVCLTVTEKPTKLADGFVFRVDVSPETLSVTHLSSWNVGQKINLEASLRVGDSMGGHWVSGHVDGLGHVRSIHDVGDGHQRWYIAPPEALMGLISDRGSVSVDGCSLTVVEVDAQQFAFNMIPHTQSQTSFYQRQVGDAVHVEVDILARYITRWNSHQKK